MNRCNTVATSSLRRALLPYTQPHISEVGQDAFERTKKIQHEDEDEDEERRRGYSDSHCYCLSCQECCAASYVESCLFHHSYVKPPPLHQHHQQHLQHVEPHVSAVHSKQGEKRGERTRGGERGEGK